VAKFKPLRNGVDSNYVLGGDLNPILGFRFPLFSRVLPWGISIRVETCGSERKQKFGKLWSIYVQMFYVFCSSLPFHGDVENPIRLCAHRQSCAARFLSGPTELFCFP
jgi:hypothetical protein